MNSINNKIKNINCLKEKYYDLMIEFSEDNIGYILKYYDKNKRKMKSEKYYYPLYINLFYLFLNRIKNFNSVLKFRYYETIEADVWNKMVRSLEMFINRIEKEKFGIDIKKNDYINYATIYLNEIITEKINNDENLIRKPINLIYKNIDKKNSLVREYLRKIIALYQINYLEEKKRKKLLEKIIFLYEHSIVKDKKTKLIKYVKNNKVKYKKLLYKAIEINMTQDELIYWGERMYKNFSISHFEKIYNRLINKQKENNINIEKYIIEELNEIMINIYIDTIILYLNTNDKIKNNDFYKIIKRYVKKCKCEYLIPEIKNVNLFTPIITSQMIEDYIFDQKNYILKNIKILLTELKDEGINIKDKLIEMGDSLVINSMNINNKDNDDNEFANVFDEHGERGNNYSIYSLSEDKEAINDIIRSIIVRIEKDKYLSKFDIKNEVLTHLINGIPLTHIKINASKKDKEKIISKIITIAQEEYQI